MQLSNKLIDSNIKKIANIIFYTSIILWLLSNIFILVLGLISVIISLISGLGIILSIVILSIIFIKRKFKDISLLFVIISFAILSFLNIGSIDYLVYFYIYENQLNNVVLNYTNSKNTELLSVEDIKPHPFNSYSLKKNENYIEIKLHEKILLADIYPEYIYLINGDSISLKKELDEKLKYGKIRFKHVKDKWFYIEKNLN